MNKINNKTKYFIKIDQRTIKKNKNAGSETTLIPGVTTIKFETTNLPSDFKDGENCYFYQTQVNNDGSVMATGEITDRKLAEKYWGSPNVQIEINRDVQEFRHLPEPDYFFEYENTEVVCEHCGQSIMTDDLESDMSYNGEDEHYSDTICPKCGGWECVDLEYEDIEDAIKNKLNL